MKLYATLENSKGKKVSLADNEQIVATVYEGNKKQYSIIIEWCNVGDLEEPTMSSLVTVKEWRNDENYLKQLQAKDTGKCTTCGETGGRHSDDACEPYQGTE